ncbi:MAG: hypothetical protein AAF850_08100, partial [Pseudomonadota bacterium]
MLVFKNIFNATLGACVLLFLLTVQSSAQDANDIASLIENASSERALVLPAGDYFIEGDIKVRKNIRIDGNGNVRLIAAAPLAKGILNTLPNVNLTVSGISFEGATSPDKNGAGIRHDGDTLTILDCRFIRNENGVLATGADAGIVRIDRSEFLENGYGDGYSHGIYLSSGGQLRVKRSSFTGTRIGHHVKSLATFTIIDSTTFYDADGKTSYAVDASRGGALLITNSMFTKAENASNNAFFNYDLTRGGRTDRVEIIGNQINNARRNAVVLRNATPARAVI